MEYTEFINRVQERGLIEDEHQAEQVVEATLSTLAQCIDDQQAKKLASYLPQEMQNYLQEKEGLDDFSPGEFKLKDFYEKVSLRSGSHFPAVIRQTRAVMSVVQEAAQPGEVEQVKRQLPEEYDSLFNFSS